MEEQLEEIEIFKELTLGEKEKISGGDSFEFFNEVIEGIRFIYNYFH